MGLFNFIKDAGEKFSDFVTGDGRDETAIRNRIDQLGLKIENLGVDVHGDKAVLTGMAPNRDVFEKAILAAGNIRGIASVESKMTVTQAQPTMQQGQPVQGQPSQPQQTQGQQPQVQARQSQTPNMQQPQQGQPQMQAANQQPGSQQQGGQQAEPQPVFYVVKSGDTLSKISKQFYGNANEYNKIFEANRPMLKSPDAIYPNQTLRIPDAEMTRSAAA